VITKDEQGGEKVEEEEGTRRRQLLWKQQQRRKQKRSSGAQIRNLELEAVGGNATIEGEILDTIDTSDTVDTLDKEATNVKYSTFSGTKLLGLTYQVSTRYAYTIPLHSGPSSNHT